MHLKSLKQSPLNTTRLGVLHGVAAYYGLDLSDATLFGATGHAFIINVSDDICPSGPYVWDATDYVRLARNIGIEITDLGFFGPDSSTEARADAEQRLRDALDAGIPCSMLNLEHQLITGYDDTGFETEAPWPAKPDFPPKRLTFGSWAELGDEVHVNFYTYRLIEASDWATMVRESLRYASALGTDPARESPGPAAWDNWLAGIDEHGAEHGNWWNATVWGECRAHAARYLSEIAERVPDAADTGQQLVEAYSELADGLEQAASTDMPSPKKKELIASLRDRDREAARTLGQVAAMI